MLKLAKHLIFVFLILGVLLIAGCSQYFGQETRGQQVTPTPTTPSLDLLQRLDADDDGDIDNDDFFVFSSYFGTVKGGGMNDAGFNYDANYDFNDDGKIDNDDVFLLSEHFGKTVPKFTDQEYIYVIKKDSRECQDILRINIRDFQNYFDKDYVEVPEDLLQYCFATPATPSIMGDVFLGENIVNVFGDVIGSGGKELDSLFTGKVTFQSKDYKVAERLYLNKNKNITPQTSLTSSDDDYKENVVLEFEKGAMQYIYSFDEPISLGSVSKENPLDIDFLGKKLRIISVESVNKITAEVDIKQFLTFGEPVKFGDKKITLGIMGSNGEAWIYVDDVKELFNVGDTKEINGLKITYDDSFYSGDQAANAAYIIVRNQIVTIQDGDGYFGGFEGDNACENEEFKDPDCWKFIVKNMDADGVTEIFNDVQKGIYYGANGPVLGLRNDFALNDDKDNPPLAGECVRMPEKYLGICFNGLNYEDEEAMGLTIARETINFDSKAREALVPNGLYTSTAIQLSASGRNALLINIAAKDFTRKQGMPDLVVANTVWLNVYNRGAVGVYASEYNGVVRLLGWVNKSKSSEAIFVNQGQLGLTEDFERVGITIGYEDTRINIDVKPYKRYSQMQMESLSSFWTLDSRKDVVGLGKTQAMEEAEELMWFSGNNAVNLGTKDENHRTKAGIVILEPKSYGALDAVKLKIPYGILKANIAIEGKSGKNVPAVEVPQPVGGQTGGGGGGGGLNGDYNGNGCIDAKSVDGVLIGEDGEAFLKYYNAGDKRADLDGNGVVDLEDFLFFSEQAGKFGCDKEIKPKEPKVLTETLRGRILSEMKPYNYFLAIGDSVLVSSLPQAVLVALLRGGSQEDALVSVGEMFTLSAGEQREIGDLQITNQEQFYSADLAAQAATLLIYFNTTFKENSQFVNVGDTLIFPSYVSGRTVTLVRVGSQGDILLAVGNQINVSQGSTILTHKLYITNVKTLPNAVNITIQVANFTLPFPPTTIPGFITWRSADVRCYNGTGFRLGPYTHCFTNEAWWERALQVCKGSCTTDGSKCGIDTFGVAEVC